MANDDFTWTGFPHRSGTGLVAVSCWLAAWLTGCYADQVQPGFYGSAEDAGPATAPSATTQPAAAMTQTGTGEDAGVGVGADGGLGTGVGAGSDAGADAGAGAGPASPCDLTGRWIATDHEVSTGLGAQEAAHTWYLLELAQTGSAGTVTRGLDCGQNVRGISAVSAEVDYPKTWPALLAKVTQTGRKFTSKAAGAGCAVSFAKSYSVLGATVSFYTDPSQTMPTASQQAMGTTPGWEDWDSDGNPGITLNVTGLATGQIYVAMRTYTAWSGTVGGGAPTFKLADDWNAETDLLGYNGSSLLASTASATRDNDASLHFIEFARLAATQATGDDATTCAAIRSLAPSLTPSGAGN